MSIKKVRCPNCGEVNMIDPDVELKTQEQIVKRATQKTFEHGAKTIIVTCVKCGQLFKISV